jgi:TPR repeat protein
VVPGVGDLALNAAEEKQMREEAAAGNAAAAYRLALYFEMVRLNDAEGEAWLRRAADLGHAGARKWLDEMADRRRMGQVSKTELDASRRR